MPNHNHYLLTRFNIRTSWTQDRQGSPVLTDAWLEQRLGLFEQYCLPSVIGQSCQDFRWLIMIDELSSNQFMQRLEALTGRYDHVSIVATNANRIMQDLCATILSQATAEKIITSRLDNDDILHRDYIETVQRLARAADNKTTTLIDLPNGYQLASGKSNNKLLQLTDPSNAFISIVEPISTLKTVWDRTHSQWHLYNPTLRDTSERYWVQVIHDTNLTNKQIRHLRVVLTIDPVAYSLPKSLSLASGGFHNLLRPYFFLVESTKRAIYRLVSR